MSIVRMNEISKVATEMMNEYLEGGYILSSTMSGHQGEIMKVDLSNGKEIIRILVDKVYKHFDKIVEVKVLRYDEKNSKHTLWNNEGEVISEVLFYEICNKRYNNEVYVDSEEEYKNITEKRTKRFTNKARAINNKKEFCDNAKEIVLPFMKRQPKCKTIKKGDIDKVVKVIYNDSVAYKIFAKNNTYVLS